MHYYGVPTYEQVGITAAWVVTICRMAQGLSSLGEIMGAEIYVAEITKPPISYVAVSLISLASTFGSIAALSVATLSTRQGFNWRTAFWIGAAIAVVGSVARTRLRETPEFTELKNQKLLDKANEKVPPNKIWLFQKSSRPEWKVKIPFSTSFHYFLVYCGWPLTFYLGFMYFNPTLKEVFKYSAEDIITHNLWLAVTTLFTGSIWIILSYSIFPLKLLKIRGIFALLLMAVLPFLINLSTSTIHIFSLQVFILTFHLGGLPADALFIKQFPVYKRFTSTTFLYALTRAVMYVITSFGAVYLSDWYGHKGLLFLTIPSCLAFLKGVRYFEKLVQVNNSSQVAQIVPKAA